MGGRKQRSAIDAVLLLQNFTERHLNKQKVVTSIFLDVMGAFDRLQPSKLILVLEDLQLPQSFISWVSSFLQDRKISLLFNGQLSPVYSVTGAPQGSPISPLLFLISISQLFTPSPIKNLLELSYVDDICISFASTSVKKNISVLSNYLSDFTSKAKLLSITFEISKSEMMHFCKKKEPIPNTISLENLTLEPKPLIKWLGVWLHYKLSFKTHVEKRLHLAQGALQRLIQLSSKSKGLGFNALRQLYQTCIIPVLDYGSVLWFNKYGTGKLSNMCDKLQKQAIPFITGAYRSSPSKALEVEAAIIPTKVRLLKTASFYALRILKFHTSHPIYATLSSNLQDELDFPSESPDLGIFAFLNQRPSGQLERIALLLKNLSNSSRLDSSNAKWSPPWASHRLQISISQSCKEDAKIEHQSVLTSIPNSSFIVYTDGSQIKNKGCGIGIAIYLPHTRELKCLSFFLGKNIGISDAESYAILKSLQHISKIQANADCYLFSDSQVALLRLSQSPNSFSHKIRALGLKMNIKLQWCPGHQGIEGNELADNLARQGLDKTLQKRDKFTTYSFLVESIRKRIISAWQSDWSKQVLREEEGKKASGLGRFYRIAARQSTPTFKMKAIKLQKYTRGTQSSYFQARTGIGNTLAYLKLIGKVSSDMCNFCHRKKQTMQHLLLHCPQFSADRKMAYEGLEPLNLQILFNTNVGREKLLRYLELSKCISLEKQQILIL